MISHVHTHFSDGLLSVEEAMGLSGVVVIVDHLTVSASLSAHLRDHRRVPLVGAELYVRSSERNEHITMLAFNNTGFSRLCELISACPLLPDWSWAERLEGLVITTSCMSSALYRAARSLDAEVLKEASRRIAEAGGVFAVEAFPWDSGKDLKALNAVARRFAGGRVLRSSDLHLLPNPSEWVSYRLGLLARGDRRGGLHPLKGGEGFYRKMLQAAPFITRLAESPIPTWLERLLPTGPIADLSIPRAPEAEIRAFREWVVSAAGDLDAHHRSEVLRELHAVSTNEAVLSYLALIWRVIRALERHHIPLQLRGSAAGSALCWLISGCTTPSPVTNGCMFERFYNPARDKDGLPDVDIDVADQDAAVWALRAEGFRVERLCVVRTASDPEEVLRAAAVRLGRTGARKVEAEENAKAIASAFGYGIDEIHRAAQRLAESRFPLDLAPHPCGFVVVPPGWSFPPLPRAPEAILSGAVLVSADDLRWKIDLLQSDALAALSAHAPAAIAIAASAVPNDKIPNAFRIGAAGLFQIGRSAVSAAMAMRDREVSFADLCRMIAGYRPGAVGFLFQEDAMRAVMREAEARGLDPLALADAARRWVSKSDEEAWRLLQQALSSSEALGRLRASAGYSFCLAHAVAYASRLLAEMLVLETDPEAGARLLLEAAKRERDNAQRAAVLMHLLARLFRGGAFPVRLAAGESRVGERELVLGPDVLPGVTSVIGMMRRRPFTREGLADGISSQLIAQQVGFSLDLVVAAAAIIANPKPQPGGTPVAGVYAWVIASRLPKLALITPYGPIEADGQPAPGLAFWDKRELKWKRVGLKALSADPRVPEVVLEVEG